MHLTDSELHEFVHLSSDMDHWFVGILNNPVNYAVNMEKGLLSDSNAYQGKAHGHDFRLLYYIHCGTPDNL